MLLPSLLPLSLSLLSLLPLTHSTSTPLHTSSRWILDSSSARVKFRCVNWAAHLETNIPEGLQHAPIPTLVSRIAALPFNCVRLTYSIDMALSPSVPVSDSFSNAASASGADPAALEALRAAAAAHNPVVANGSRADVFGAVVAALAEADIMVVLDNHVSRATWCCNLTDGNGWWADAPGYVAENSRYFDTEQWLEGLGAMAGWANDYPNVVAMGVRNEIRGIPVLQDGPAHDVWYDRAARGIDAITAANQGVLAVVGGTLGATDFSFLRTRALDRSAWEGRVVWEYHVYSYSVGYATGSCDLFKTQMGAAAGYLLEQGKDYTGPLWMSEFGFGMVGGPNQGLSDQDWNYFECLREYLEGNDADWGIWALQGDYYVRDGITSHDESYGVLNKDWSGLRNSAFHDLLGDMWNVTQTP